MAVIEARPLSLDAIAASGQTFTWRRHGGSWLVASGARRCLLSQKDGAVEVTRPDGGEPDPDELAYWKRYLALDLDYAQVLRDIALPAEVQRAGAGIRVLRQDWWDTAVSFVISQNSNITRIQRTVDALMDASGGVVPAPPKLRALLEDDDFASGLKLGYRSPYLEALADRCCSWHPSRVDDAGVLLDQSLSELQELSGIGPKVANCICLFGLGYMEAVPRDTWIRRAEQEFDIDWHPRWGGIQQQYVFAWMRQRA
ncbi:MAG: DNA glycosylase [Coriobacteriales bacterium]|jgi:N-glycosylase/DNA lyase